MEQFDLETTHGRVRVYKRGVGAKKLLLLHGAGCDHAMLTWRDTMERLYYDDYTAYAPDLLGYGGSERPEGMAGDTFYRTHAETLGEVCDMLGLREFALAGLSMGGAIAVCFALRDPKRVKQLFLIDPWGVAGRLPHHRMCFRYLKKEKRIKIWYARIAKQRLLAGWLIGYSLIGDKKKITPQLVDEVQEACRREDAGQSMCDYVKSSLTKKSCIPDFEKDWERLSMPVIFIQGEKDPLVAAGDVRDAVFAVPNGTYYELAGCKHWSVREQPGEFIRIMEQHMQS